MGWGWTYRIRQWESGIVVEELVERERSLEIENVRRHSIECPRILKLGRGSVPWLNSTWKVCLPRHLLARGDPQNPLVQMPLRYLAETREKSC